MLKYLEGEFLNLNINFNYFGFLDKDELGKKILENSVVIVPSLYDNSAFAAQEAMSYGRFTICSNKGGTSEYVGEYGLVFDPISRQSTDSMLEDLKKTNLLDVAMRARNFSISKFSNSLYAERYLQIIKNALD
jgi:glycosyltransferase involved in cell wall biosynthesis